MKIVFIAVLLANIFCAPTYHVNRKYYHYDYSDKKLAIWPVIPFDLGNGITVINENLIDSCFYTIQRKVIQYNDDVTVIKPAVQSTKNIEVTEKIIYTHPIGNVRTSRQYEIPSGSSLSIYPEKPDYLMVIESVGYQIDKSTRTLKISYILWSYEGNEPVTCGIKTRTYTPEQNIMSAQDYRHLYTNIARAIFFNSPFSLDE